MNTQQRTGYFYSTNPFTTTYSLSEEMYENKMNAAFLDVHPCFFLASNFVRATNTVRARTPRSSKLK